MHSIALKTVVIASFAALATHTFAQKPTPAVVNKKVMHKLSAEQLSRLAGTLFWDKATKAALAPALKELLGTDWSDYEKNFHTTSPLTFKDGRLVGTGNWGPSTVALELRVGGFTAAAMNDNGKCTDYGPVNPGYLCDDLTR